MGVDTGVDIYAARAAGARGLEFPVGEVDHLAAAPGERTVVIDDLDGGSFSGAYVGGVLSGTYTPTGGSPVEVSVSMTYVVAGDVLDWAGPACHAARAAST